MNALAPAPHLSEKAEVSADRKTKMTGNDAIPPAQELDLRRLKCPLPVLKSRRALAALASGDRLRVIADDPMAAIDIPHMCNQDGHRLIDQTSEDGRLVFLIEHA